MPTFLEALPSAQRSTTVFHPISMADQAAMAGLRAIVEPNKGRLEGTAARYSARSGGTEMPKAAR